MHLIETKGLCRSYQSDDGELEILKGINLTIEEGEFVAIVGPSGSGKSTLMQILGLLDRPTSGSYHLLGRDVSKLSDDQGAALRSRTIGFVFQMFNLLPRTSALDNVVLPMVYSGVAHREERGLDVLKQVGLQDRVHHRPNELSGGQQQRVAIARSLVNFPKIIFADEPTGNLASDQAEDFLRQMELLNRAGISIILVTHDPDIAARTKRIIKLKDGEIVSDAPNTAGSGSSGNGGVSLKTDVRQSPATLDLTTPKLSWAEVKEFGTSAIRAMAANKASSILSMLGIMIGVAAVIAMLAIGKGAQKSVEARIAGLGSNLILFYPSSTSRLNFEDVKAISQLPDVQRAEGNVLGLGQAVFKSRNWNTKLMGTMQAYAAMHNAQPYYGRFFTDVEDRHLDRVCLLGQTVVDNLFTKQDPVGQIIKINQIDFKVIGILPIKGSSESNDRDNVIALPVRTAMKRILGRMYLDYIDIEADSPDTIDSVMTDVSQLMRHRHHIPNFRGNDFYISSKTVVRTTLTGSMQTCVSLLNIVAAISLLVGGIGIMNIMLVSIGERTREIGLRKAVGATGRAILAQFLIEAAILSTIGGIVGILLGISISIGLSMFAGWSAIVTPQAVALAFVFSMCVGIVFGFWPARKASLLPPIEALRYE